MKDRRGGGGHGGGEHSTFVECLLDASIWHTFSQSAPHNSVRCVLLPSLSG